MKDVAVFMSDQSSTPPRAAAQAVLNQRQYQRNRLPVHFKRARAEVKLSGLGADPTKIIEARVLLNDITPKGIGLFTTSPMLPSQEISITVDQPKRLYVRGRIVWCMEHNANTHILSETKYAYRVGIQFIFDTEEERQALAKYVQELEAQFLYGKEAL